MKFKVIWWLKKKKLHKMEEFPTDFNLLKHFHEGNKTK